VEFVEVDARSFDYAPERRLRPGDLLYRPATSVAAVRVEQFLAGPGVAAFYSQPDGLFFDASTPPLLFERAGLPVPSTVFVSTADRVLLRGFVGRLGGFPVVLKLLGFEGGLGVMLLDSFPALFSVLDYALAQGRNPYLSAYVPNAVQWRLIVIGDRVVVAYQNHAPEGDFRHRLDLEQAGFTVDVRPELAALAVRAVRAIGREFGGVDVLEQPDGNLWVLEANFPCYFAHAHTEGGLDVAGPMVDFLLAKARRLAA
jgi:glutathione synthase/RimK-type ligase-like ATP-grasp enzyme